MKNNTEIILKFSVQVSQTSKEVTSHSVNQEYVRLLPGAGFAAYTLFGLKSANFSRPIIHVTPAIHCSLSVVMHAPFHASMPQACSQAGPMHESAGVGNVS